MVTIKELNLAIPPEVLKLKVGEICRILVYFDYIGPAISGKLYAAIGRVGILGFDEIVNASSDLNVPATATKTKYQAPVNIYISSAMKVASDYDMYAKIIGITGPDIFSPTYENIIEIVSPLAVEVKLKNAPTAGEQWYLMISDQARTQTRIVTDVPITQAITFDNVPQDWLPLPFYILIYKAVTRETVAIYQSWDSTFAGYIKGVYIPSFGSYYFNCSTKLFEKI